jgi:hypothetical protein
MTKTKELPKNIETWVTALESGEYPQCERALYNGEGYCCLGVYAKVVFGFADEYIISDKTECDPVGPQEVYEKIQHDDDMDSSVYHNGIDMNDAGESFIDIAKMIREAYT